MPGDKNHHQFIVIGFQEILNICILRHQGKGKLGLVVSIAAVL